MLVASKRQGKKLMYVTGISDKKQHILNHKKFPLGLLKYISVLCILSVP